VGYNIIEVINVNVINGVLLEEKQRNLEMQESYINEIKKLPRGSVTIKQIGKKNYCYLKYRNGDKIVTEYVGNCEKNLNLLQQQIEKRHHFEKLLRELKDEYKIIKRVVKD
jgi:hypothetical protein